MRITHSLLALALPAVGYAQEAKDTARIAPVVVTATRDRKSVV